MQTTWTEAHSSVYAALEKHKPARPPRKLIKAGAKRYIQHPNLFKTGCCLACISLSPDSAIPVLNEAWQ